MTAVLDVACGTGFLTRHAQGEVTGLDQSEAMLAVAREQAPDAEYVLGDAFDLPFPDGSFDRVLTAHSYGHLEPPQQRPVSDGTVWPVFKRFFLPEQLVEELGGGEILYAGAWFVVVRA